MEHFYKIKVAGLERDLPVCKITDDLSIAAFVLFGDVEMTVAGATHLLKAAPEHDIIITAEAKGIPLVHEMAKQNGESRYIIARKVVKLYMKEVFSVSLQSITTEKKQHLYIDTAEAKLMQGKRVLIVDDVISTGESLRAVEKLVKEAGGIVAGKMAILAEGDAKYRDDIIFLEYLPLLDRFGMPLADGKPLDK
ncbi:MAG: adenine phosphoribosyltransferase [Lachnospiraceae bacterium]|nr:adenine phosphoribosyltransferase [Lachnospiraceae bacterium]